jgi:hypothetical protein
MNNINEIIKDTAAEVLIEKKNLIENINKLNDTTLNFMVRERCNLLVVIRNSNILPNNIINDNKLRRNYLCNEIKRRVKVLRSNKIQQLIDRLEHNFSNNKPFIIQRLLSNSKFTQFKINDNNERRIINGINQIVSNFYQNFFNKVGLIGVEPFINDVGFPLVDPINYIEVEIACMKLNNNRSAGLDGLVGEYFKYGGNELYRELSIIYNNIFINNQLLDSALDGILIPLNKPNKSLLVTNTRPIILLNMIRKILSNILYN